MKLEIELQLKVLQWYKSDPKNFCSYVNCVNSKLSSSSDIGHVKYNDKQVSNLNKVLNVLFEKITIRSK